MLLIQADAVGQVAAHTAQGQAPLVHRNGSLYVPASLGRRPLQWFIVDTGSYRSYLTARGYERLKSSGIVPRKDGELGPLSVWIGGRVLGSVSFALDTTGFVTPMDQGSDGILGLDVLSKNKIGIDVPRGLFGSWPADARPLDVQRAWFSSGDRSLHKMPYSTDLWDLGDHTYGVRVEVANLSLPMCVDTGSFETDLSRELGTAVRPRLKAGSSKGTFYFGVADIDYYRVSGCEIGGESIDVKSPIGATRMPTCSGILGTDVLDSQRMLFDFPGGKFYLRGEDRPASRPATGKGVFAGPTLELPTGVTIRWPLGEVVRVEPGCRFTAPKGYRKIKRPDGTLDLVPPGTRTPRFKPLPPLLTVPTINGTAYFADYPLRVQAGTRYTAPPNWRRVRRSDGATELYPPARQ